MLALILPLFLRRLRFGRWRGRRPEERFPVPAVHAEGTRQSVDRIGLRLVAAVFQVADIALSHAGFRGEFVLAQAGCLSKSPKLSAESAHDKSNRFVLTEANTVVVSHYCILRLVQL